MSRLPLKGGRREVTIGPSYKTGLTALEDGMKHAILGALVVVGLWSARASGAGDDTTAKQILGLAKVKKGLCLHIGAGGKRTAGLTAALAGNGSMLVHGLALDDKSLVRAREAVSKQNLLGRAMIEKVGSRTLPYLRDLANLIVVEDMSALARLGIGKDEILRVLAPGGVLCVRQGRRWTSTVKPRPEGMDDWTHPQHGADGNMVSTDKLVKFPLGFRWIDGLPVNINRWAACRGWVISDGRCYTLSANEMENLTLRRSRDHWLAARDAFNGLPLWKIRCGTTDDGAYLNWRNAGPLVAGDGRVYAARKGNTILSVDGATGRVDAAMKTSHQAVRLALLEGTLVASCWEAKEKSVHKPDGASLWATWFPKTGVGSIEAFDAETGKAKWSLPFPAYMLVASDGMVYALTHVGNPPKKREVVGIDLKTGRELWRVPYEKIGAEPDLQLNSCGPGYVIVGKRTKKGIAALSAKDGSVLWQVKPVHGLWTPVIDGELWCDSRKYDPRTGKELGRMPAGPGNQGCTPSVVVWPYVTRTRGCRYHEFYTEGGQLKVRGLSYTGARGACMEGMVPANGMFYTAQNNCRCAPGQVYGFLAVGPSGEWPKAPDFAAPRPVEKGPAFGKVVKVAAKPDDWPTFRHDAARTAATAARAPSKLIKRWQTKVILSADNPLEHVWRARVASKLTAPVVAGGRVFAAAADEGRVFALDAVTGSEMWSTVLGGRVDSPPTIHEGLCLVGCRDGWVYALSASDGKLAWRTRLAPFERLMVAHGAVESVWPAVGTVLVHEGVAYVNAGRTSESDGGIAVAALDPATGRLLWGKAISAGPKRQNDFLILRDGAIGWWNVKLDPKTGEAGKLSLIAKRHSQGGMLDGTWTVVGKRRSGYGFRVGKAVADLLAWNDSLVAATYFAVSREKAAMPPGGPPLDAKGRPMAVRLVQDDYSWRPSLPAGGQAEAVVMAGGAVLYGGRIKGKTAGFLYAVSAETGKKLSEAMLDDAPTYDGVAVAGGKVYVTLQNGTIACFGE